MDIFFSLLFRVIFQFAFGLYLAFIWSKMTLIILSWLDADLFVTILFAVALVGSMYLFQHLLLESRSRLKSPSEITFQESVKPLAIAAGLALIAVVFVCAVFPVSLNLKLADWKEVLLTTILSLWFLLPLVAYAILFVQNRNRIFNRGVR